MIARWKRPDGHERGPLVYSDELTGPQWTALRQLQERHKLPDTVEVIPGLGYIGIEVAGLFIGIEEDGHTHT